ncbi:MAG: DUF3575 domain-containing protein [Bacteroidetes bacterium]|nr:DUF3575 domain-containing protein [Bacteroidota bacterium]
MRSIRLVLSALALVMIATSSASAQYNVVKFDGLGLLRDRVYLGYERTFFKQISVGLAYENYAYTDESLDSGGDYSLITNGFLPEFRYYPFHKQRTAPLGFFAGAAFRLAKVTEIYTPNNTELTGDLFNYGLISGYKFRYKSFISEFLLGYGGGALSKGFETANRSAFRNLSDQDALDELTQNLRFEIALGYVFPKIKTKTSGKY